MKNFAITGVAGYVAPRHLKSIKETGNSLVAAIDPFDSVGILDSFFPDCSFFTEYERFDRHLEKLKNKTEDERIHYVSICSPNHLHDAHIRTALRVGADAICEKPLVLNPWNLNALAEIEAETGQRVWTILQLRVHPALVELKKHLNSESISAKHKVILTYVTSRGLWYLHSWKGDNEKSGGVATNIGVHFFDMLIWLFGNVENCEIHVINNRTCSGTLELERATVQWFLSIDYLYVPDAQKANSQRTFRSITMDGNEIEFSGGFTDLHNEIYRRTLAGKGFGIEETRKAVELVQQIRNSNPIGVRPNSHHFLRK
jgi:UDP-N-acetyl-2-amino-2-deoxyglucuronate dehydrogenase